MKAVYVETLHIIYLVEPLGKIYDTLQIKSWIFAIVFFHLGRYFPQGK
jgi:hypothetical protein